MAAQLAQVIARRTLAADAPTAFFQVQQRDFDPGLLALANHLDEHMLAIQTTVLPVPQVHARQVVRQVLEHALMHHLRVTLTGTFGMPVVEFDKPVQCFAHQQRTPLVVGIAFGAGMTFLILRNERGGR